jgi:MHS family citrate/tricarballylate:H+ symporter-like MFS transporter
MAADLPRGNRDAWKPRLLHPWQSGSQQVAVMLPPSSASVTLLTADQMTARGWRVPLFIGCDHPVRLLAEAHASSRPRPSSTPSRRPTRGAAILGANWQIVAIGVMMSILTTTTFYTITVYTPTFGTQALGLQPVEAMIVTLCAGLSNFIWLPIGGAISDRIGRRPQLFIVPIVASLTRLRGDELARG